MIALCNHHQLFIIVAHSHIHSFSPIIIPILNRRLLQCTALNQIVLSHVIHQYVNIFLKEWVLWNLKTQIIKFSWLLIKSLLSSLAKVHNLITVIIPQYQLWTTPIHTSITKEYYLVLATISFKHCWGI
jgi:hypothetical protein